MGRLETFDHTADVGLRIHAVDLDDLFRTAAEGLLDYIVANRVDVRALESEPVHLEAGNAEDLLFTWLSELIFRVETRHRLYRSVDVRVSADGTTLDAQLGGEPIDRDRHVLDHEVKAVTRHAMGLEPTDEGWTAEVILDI